VVEGTVEAEQSQGSIFVSPLGRMSVVSSHFDSEFSRADVLDAFGDARGPVTEIWVSLLSAD
jgi:hypothetical protein